MNGRCIALKKIKILLGAYVDCINAQNINCREIAKHLDKNKFEVHVLVHDTPMDEHSVISHQIGNGFISKNVGKFLLMLKLKADVYYLPRVEKVDMLFARMFGKKFCIVSSVEITTVYHNEKYRKFFNNYIFDYFCISHFLNKMNMQKWGVSKQVIYLGIPDFDKNNIVREEIKTIAFVGSVEERKRPLEFAKIAKKFPEIKFLMIGDGSLLDIIKKYKAENNIENLEFTGRLRNNEVIHQLKKADLLLLLSKEEGLPKVVLEAAIEGAPTIYIDEFYSIDYINSGINGVAVHNLEEVDFEIEDLLINKNKYRELNRNVQHVPSRFTWDMLISKYNDYFESSYRNFYCYCNVKG